MKPGYERSKHSAAFISCLQIRIDPSPAEISPPTDEQLEIPDAQEKGQQPQFEEQLEPSHAEIRDLQEELEGPEEGEEQEGKEEEFDCDGFDWLDLLFLPFPVSLCHVSQERVRALLKEVRRHEPETVEEDDEYDDMESCDDIEPLNTMSARDYVQCWLGAEAAAAMLPFVSLTAFGPGPDQVNRSYEPYFRREILKMNLCVFLSLGMSAIKKKL